jgi:formamidopyrimidine-DNA glycosylase
MPELPEVEFAARMLERATRGKEITELRLLHPVLRRHAGADRLAGAEGRRVERVERRGKHQLLALDDQSVVHVHFRMAGDWLVGTANDPEPPHARALIHLADGTRVALVDPRALSTITHHPPGSRALPELGLDATDASLSAVMLGGMLAKRRVAIKPVLLDQRVVAGLGNIYAVEALWYARIDPRAAASSLDIARLTRLIEGMRRALGEAARDPGRYSRGEAVERLNVYGREGKPCPRCGQLIQRIVQAGRSTYYCAECQI